MWRVVPISSNQLLDVRAEDLVSNGHFRVCETYRGGGGYDQFPAIAAAKGVAESPEEVSRQFVVQLYGCNLDCPYCYVTREGVWGAFEIYTTRELVAAWKAAQMSHGVNVFHLMGGAPALQLRKWPELLDALGPRTVFHSDLMLSEFDYPLHTLRALNREGVLVAVNIKGLTVETWKANTRKEWDKARFYRNLALVRKVLDSQRWYMTFTNVSREHQEVFLTAMGLEDQASYGIDLIEYDALPFVDSVPWGGRT